MEYNPYPPHRTVVPEWTECEVCDRKIKTKDWNSHRAGKQHRDSTIRNKQNNTGAQSLGSWSDQANEAAEASTTDTNGGQHTWCDSTDAMTATVANDGNAWGDSVDSNGWSTSRSSRQGGGGSGCCRNCGEEGHYARECPQNAQRGDNACYNCGEPGHLARDCTQPKASRGGGGDRPCHNCGNVGHFVRDCPEPKQGGSGGGRTCHNCGQPGHMAKECTEARKLICRNCDGEGHTSRDCQAPKDWSRVTCNNCNQKGHGAKRCPEPLKPVDDGGWNDSTAGGGWNDTAGGGWNDAAGGTNDWGNTGTNDWDQGAGNSG